MISSIISRLVVLVFGTLYPAYASYKAVRTKNVKEYVKWMMYWIVYALFTCAEAFTDIFLSWFPFYYEIKIILVIWLLSPATKGSSILYRKFVHPMLSKREQEIDEYISKAKEQSYKQVFDLGSKGVNVLMQTALKGGGGLVNQLRKSYSLSDLSDSPHDKSLKERDETDILAEPGLMRKKRVHHLASTSSGIYFSEVDVRQDLMTHVQSGEDISSGYSSGEVLFTGQGSKLQPTEGLVRTGSISSTRPRSVRITRSTIVPKKTGGFTDADENVEFATEKHIIYVNSGQCQNEDDLLINETSESSSDCEFLDPIESEELLKSSSLEGSSILDFPINSNNSKLIDCDEKSEIQVKLDIHNAIKDNLEKTAKSTDKNEPTSLYKSKSADSLPVLEIKLNQSQCSNERSGKYHKKAAPLPPPSISSKDTNSESNLKNVSTIKATLVLTPSITKTEGMLNQNSAPLDVILPSPKLKQRSISKSPSRSIKSKQESALARFIMLPKKLNFWHKGVEIKNDNSAITIKSKRSSWYSELPQSDCSLLLDSKPLSKSADDFKIINLSHSPKRQKKILLPGSCKQNTDSD